MFNPRPALSLPGWNPAGTTSSDPRGTLPTDRGTVDPASGNRRPRWYPSQKFGEVPSSSFPGEWEPEDIQRWIQNADAQLAVEQETLRQTSGLERRQIEAKIEDLKRGRDNAMEIARLQAETSRYGVDATREAALERLKEDHRQFDARHGLDTMKFGEDQRQFDARLGLDRDRYGLDVAEAYTRYSQTPDMMFARNDFVNALGRVGQGLAPRPITSEGPQPQPKSWEQFAALSGYEQLPTVQAGAGGGFRAQPMQGTTGATTDQNGDGIPDPRIKATRAIVDALPPSGAPGANDNDWSAINAITSLYQSGGPGSLERLGPARRKIAQAGLARGGFDVGLMEEQYKARRPGQGSVRAY